MADLLGTTFAANYRKTAPSTQFGTRALRFITITAGNGGDSDVNFTYQKTDGAGSYSGSYTDSDSYFARAVNALQGYCELYAVGTPTATVFTAIIADDTAQDSDTSTNVAGGWGDAEANIVAALGYGNKSGGITAYNGAITIAELTLQGGALA